MRFVLDTSAILSGKEFSGQQELYMPPSAEREIKHGRMRRRVEYLELTGMKVRAPSDEAVAKVRAYAKKTGDIVRVSEADIDVIALGIDLGATILTDDYSIQNLARGLGVQYQCICEHGITEEVVWSYRCRGCGKFFNEMKSECPVCGSALKTTRAKGKKGGNDEKRTNRLEGK